MRTTALLASIALVSPALADDNDSSTITPPAADAPQPAAAEAATTPTPPEAPVVAAEVPDNNVIEEGGMVNDTQYARGGTKEIGVNAGMMLAPGFRTVNFSPVVGWFISDQFEIAGIVGISNIKAGDQSSTVYGASVEPSYHVPVSATTFGFIGMGVGVAYIKGPGAGLAVSPRIGANVLVGGRGVLTPSLSYDYTTHNADAMEATAENITLVAASSSLRINIGYSMMW